MRSKWGKAKINLNARNTPDQILKARFRDAAHARAKKNLELSGKLSLEEQARLEGRQLLPQEKLYYRRSKLLEDDNDKK